MMSKTLLRKTLACLFAVFIAVPAWAEVIGKIKVLNGAVTIQRDGASIPAQLNASVYSEDVIRTGEESTVGLLFEDDSRIAAGPNSVLSLDQFNFDRKSHEGNFDVSVNQGTLSVISGKLTARQPGALKVKTPAAILAVRGTEFSVSVDPQAR